MDSGDQWRSVENFIYQYVATPGNRDDVTPVVDDIVEYLKTPSVKELLWSVGVMSVGYLFDRHWDTFQFFQGGEERSQHYKTPYLWKRGDQSSRFSDFIHSLFLVVRDEQRERLSVGKVHFEEFYIHLPHVLWEKPSADRAYYCPIGELLFWLYAWRALRHFEYVATPADAFVPGRLALNRPLHAPASFEWCNEMVVAAGLQDGVAELGLTDWASEYRALCLYSASVRGSTPWIGAVGNYLQKVLNRPLALGSGLAELDAMLQEAMPEWLDAVVPASERGSCKAARLWIEQNAPAPLLPYYFWNGLDTWPKTFLACPMWVSPLYPARVRVGQSVKDTPISGIALCGVSPLSAWDMTLTPELTNGDHGVRQTAKRDVTELLSLLGQPAVELNFFNPLAAELRKAERERVTARHAYVLRRGLIHEIGQLTQMVLLWGKGNVAERHIVAECTVMKLASEALAEILNVNSYENEKRYGEIIARVRSALKWDDLILDLDPADIPSDWSAPAALEYVLIELGRNAYHRCTPDPASKRRVRIETVRSEDGPRIHTVSVRQPGVLNVSSIDTDIDPDPPKPEGGIEVVRYIVKQVLNSRFVLRQEGTFVAAYVERLGSAKNTRSQP